MSEKHSPLFVLEKRKKKQISFLLLRFHYPRPSFVTTPRRDGLLAPHSHTTSPSLPGDRWGITATTNCTSSIRVTPFGALFPCYYKALSRHLPGLDRTKPRLLWHREHPSRYLFGQDSSFIIHHPTHYTHCQKKL